MAHRRDGERNEDDPCLHDVSAAVEEHASKSDVRCADCGDPLGTFYSFGGVLWQQIL